MEKNDRLEAVKEITECTMNLPVVFSQIVERLRQNKKQQEDCSSSVMKTVLENIFQLGGTLYINFGEIFNNFLKYVQTVDEIYELRYRSLIDYDNCIEYRELPEQFLSDESKALIKKSYEMNLAGFSSLRQLVATTEKTELLNELVLEKALHELASISNSILCANDRNETIELVKKGTEIAKMGVGAIPIIGPALELGLAGLDGIIMITSIVQDHLNKTASSPDMQTTDSQLRQFELQYACLQKVLEAQAPLASFADSCLSRALAEKEALETSKQ